MSWVIIQGQCRQRQGVVRVWIILNSSIQTGITVFDNVFHHVWDNTVKAKKGWNVPYMAMAMDSVNSYPSAPTKDGTFPSLLSFRYSVLRGPLEGSVSTISRSSSFALATARMAVERVLPCRIHVNKICSRASPTASEALLRGCRAFRKTYSG